MKQALMFICLCLFGCQSAKIEQNQTSNVILSMKSDMKPASHIVYLTNNKTILASFGTKGVQKIAPKVYKKSVFLPVTMTLNFGLREARLII